MIFSENPNTLWSQLFVHELAQSGLKSVVIAPGSRSTPLTLAFHAHPDIEVYRHLDERSAGFFALGMALATDNPVALVCTSGTAVANLLPALIEAKMSHVPLLALTADRPHELRLSGANQTIDQMKIYGDQVLWSVDMPLPHSDAPDVVLRHVQSMAARAYATANGLVKGPVHVNFPFRQPLEPKVEGRKQKAEGRIQKAEIQNPNSKFQIERGELILSRAQAQSLADLINQHERGLIVCGPRCAGGNFPQAVAGLSQMSGYPILADPLSGLRFGRHVADTAVLGGYETFMQTKVAWPEPEVIIRFGAVPTSKWVNAYLDRVHPTHRIHVRANGIWADDSHRTTQFIQANAENACYQVSPLLHPRPNTDWLTQLQATETAVWQALEKPMAETYFDGAIVADTITHLPDEGILFVGNSLPIRHLDQFGRPSPKSIHTFANRGASGIDGNLSTALGIAAATGKPVTAVLGDITALHDLNSLHLLKASHFTNHVSRFTFIINNNNGGGIFRRLPISQHEPPFTDLFLTPHGLEFEHAAAMFDLIYTKVASRQAFAETMVTAVAHPAPHLIEVMTDGDQDEQIRKEINQIVKEQMGSSPTAA